MDIKKPESANQYRTLFRTNMVVGVLISMIAVYFIITGQYANLETRNTVETLLNVAFIGGILYTVAFWYICVLSRPHLEKRFSRHS